MITDRFFDLAMNPEMGKTELSLAFAIETDRPIPTPAVLGCSPKRAAKAAEKLLATGLYDLNARLPSGNRA